LFLPAGGGWEPFLTASVTYDEADTEAHAMELTSLYPPPCISLTEILLVAGLVTASVLLIGFLVIKLRTEKKEKAILLDRIQDLRKTIFDSDVRYARTILKLNQSHQAEVDGMQRRMEEIARLAHHEFPQTISTAPALPFNDPYGDGYDPSKDILFSSDDDESLNRPPAEENGEEEDAPEGFVNIYSPSFMGFW